MTVDSGADLRSLGESGLADDRWRPTATGTAANRPAVGLFRANAFYYETDTGLLWYSNGVTWAQITVGATALGAWTSYTPTWSCSGTAPALGNGVVSGKYAKVGRLVTVHIKFLPGTTTTFGTGQFFFTLPVTGAAVTGNEVVGSCLILDSSANQTFLANSTVSSTTLLYCFVAAVANYAVGQLNPMTWATGDTLQTTLTYEAAA